LRKGTQTDHGREAKPVATLCLMRTLEGAMPNFSNFSGCSTGYCTTSCSSRFTPSRPPMSSQDTLGT